MSYYIQLRHLAGAREERLEEDAQEVVVRVARRVDAVLQHLV